MPYNKGDFTQQGVNGHVNATVRLNEKRLVNIDLTSNEEAEGCTIAGTVTDLLNDKVYSIGSAPSGNIEITENGENINVAPYATATVNVSGGGTEILHCTVTIVNNTGRDLPFNPNSTLVLSTEGNALAMVEELNPLVADRTIEIDALYKLFSSDPNDMYAVMLENMFRSVSDTLVTTASNAVNCTAMIEGNNAIIMLTNAETPSSITITYTLENEPN